MSEFPAPPLYLVYPQAKAGKRRVVEFAEWIRGEIAEATSDMPSVSKR